MIYSDLSGVRMSIEQLFVQSDAIGQAVSRLSSAIEKSQPAPEIVGIIAQLTSLLSALFEHESARIYGPLQGQDAYDGVDCGVLCHDSRRLQGDWFAFLAEWVPECVSADFDAFAAEAAALIERLNDLLSRVRNTLYPFALGKGLIRLRA